MSEETAVEFTRGPLHVGGQTFETTVRGFRTIRTVDGTPTAYVADRANAKLYAAAPDLYEALMLIADEKCERLTSGDCWDRPEWTVDAPYTDDRVCDTCIARRALARAEGR